MAEPYRYAAFISYSSKDASFARRLHRALEGYGIPASLGKFDIIGGGKKNRIYPGAAHSMRLTELERVGQSRK